MTEVRTTIPAADLTPGQFFKVNDRWHRALTAAKGIAGNPPQIKVANPTNGGNYWMWLHSVEVTVNEGNTIPVAFQASTLMRKSRAAREQANELNRTADRLAVLAADIQLDSSLTS